MTEKYDVKPEQAKMLEDLGKIIGKPIPLLVKIQAEHIFKFYFSRFERYTK